MGTNVRNPVVCSNESSYVPQDARFFADPIAFLNARYGRRAVSR